MSDTPGWASPGPDPSSEERQTGASGAAEPMPTDKPAPAAPAAPAGEAPQSPDAKIPDAKGPEAPEAKWAEGQPPPGQWSAPTGAPA
ncbi:hypothetical protein GT028_23285, partial [Streptomyces sp. SID2999]|nr:hypothetical protein [Streptomyces sp. SID2999]